MSVNHSFSLKLAGLEQLLSKSFVSLGCSFPVPLARGIKFLLGLLRKSVPICVSGITAPLTLNPGHMKRKENPGNSLLRHFSGIKSPFFFSSFQRILFVL